MSETVLITDNGNPDLDVEQRILGGMGAELLLADTGEEAELVRLAPRADAILANWRPVTAAVLDAAPRCKVIGRYGVGVDNIDVAHATELGIVVANVPGFCTDEVADHTVMLLLTLARRFVAILDDVRAGGWDHRVAGPPIRLRGTTLGLVGYGAIAQAVAARARALGMRTIAYRRSAGQDPQTEITTLLPELLAQSDVVSLHVPLADTTRGLIGAAELAAMRNSAYLINTSRGGLVDTEALLRALDEGQIAGAALDVTDPEPLPPDHPLRHHPRAVVTPHAAFYSAGSAAEVAERAARGVERALLGKVPDHVVNPEVLTAPQLRLTRQQS